MPEREPQAIHGTEAGALSNVFDPAQALGVDDGKLLIPLILIPTIIFILYQGFGAEQDNEDFFDTYDQRRR